MSALEKDFITTYMDYTEESEPPAQFRLWAAISTIAAALQRKCVLPWGMLRFYPNLYVVLIGPSGSRKGTAMNPALEMLQELGVKLASEAITREALIRELKQSNASAIDGRTGVPHMHASLTIFSPELTVFLGYQNKQLMSDLTDWYDCRDRWTYRTKGSGVDEIIGVWVNLFGGTTPELIQTSMPLEAIGGGLTSRILFIYGAGKARKVIIPTGNPILRQQLLEDLGQIHMMAGEFKPSENFLQLYAEWYTKDGDLPMNDPRFGGYVERRANHLLKLSMIMNASRTRDMILTEVDFVNALEVLTKAEKRMPQVFLGVGKNPHAEVITRMMTSLALSGGKIGYGDLYRRYLHDVSPHDFDACVQSIVQIGSARVGVEGGEKVIYAIGDLKDGPKD